MRKTKVLDYEIDNFAPCIRKTHGSQIASSVVLTLLVEFPCGTLIVFLLACCRFLTKFDFDTTSSTCTIVFRPICPPHHLDFKPPCLMIFGHRLQTIHTHFQCFSPFSSLPSRWSTNFQCFLPFLRFVAFLRFAPPPFILSNIRNNHICQS